MKIKKFFPGKCTFYRNFYYIIIPFARNMRSSLSLKIFYVILIARLTLLMLTFFKLSSLLLLEW